MIKPTLTLRGIRAMTTQPNNIHETESFLIHKKNTQPYNITNTHHITLSKIG